MSSYIRFPVSKDASADAYEAFCNANNPDTGSLWCRPNMRDKFGQRVVPYLGPGGFIWNGEPYPEPEGGEAARADGVLSETVEWPEDE